MSDESQATPKAELGRQIMDPSVPKNEREWWAAAEIARLRAELAASRRQERERCAQIAANALGRAEAEIERLQGRLAQWENSLVSPPLEAAKAEIARLQAENRKLILAMVRIDYEAKCDWCADIAKSVLPDVMPAAIRKGE
jgi:chromosome segregation ATPase